MMDWPEHEVASWAEFLQWAMDTTSIRPGKFAFRGQEEASWRLRPSLIREIVGATSLVGEGASITREEVLAVEESCRRHFVKEGFRHLSHGEQVDHPDKAGKVSWWALMQQYGAATRLLDWTRSVFVGAYFAVRDCGVARTAGAVWYFDQERLREAFAARTGMKELVVQAGDLDRMLSEYAEQELVVGFGQGVASEREVAQQGMVTVCTDVLADHADAIGGLLRDQYGDEGQKPGMFGRVVIPFAEKYTFWLRLEEMNVRAAVLFPGIDGVGRTVREEAWVGGLGRVLDRAGAGDARKVALK